MAIFNKILNHWFKLSMFMAISSMLPSDSGKVNGESVKNIQKDHVGFEPASGDMTIDEIVWGNMRDMVVKDVIKVKAKSQELPIQLYSKGYQIFQGARYNAVRLASVAMIWMPTSIHFEGYITIMVMDERFTKDSWSKASLLNNKRDSIPGKLIASVTFDPNFQQLISGSINFATAVSDINKIKFYLMFDDLNMPTSIAGFLTTSWKTIGSDGAVFNEIQWDVFRFPRLNVQEVDMKYGKTLFEKLKIDMKSKYESQKHKMAELDKLRFQLTHANDAGLSKLNDTTNKYEIELGKLVVDADKHIEAIKLQKKKDIIMKLTQELREVLNSRDIAEINAKKAEIIETCKRESIEIPDGIDINGIPGIGVVKFSTDSGNLPPADK
ncbi:P4 [Lilac chlorotic ringspot-associated virus]|uniref:P4 n=1 Tax=Lilac chlorotic ringspot-associated virus TaxID=2719116 RepID=A0A6G8QI90_9VIRU|nr:P4 [Lilac chlorotic ringspot-associated virus]QIN85948.1 P4 [Lilac chlorotic ringspot-associated virus]